MSDARLRDAERRWRESGAPEDEATWWLERVRAGELSWTTVRVWAYAGQPVARLAAPARSVDDLRDLLPRVPWFSRLGRPSDRDAGVTRVTDWSAWDPEAFDASGALALSELQEPLARRRLGHLAGELERLTASITARCLAGYDEAEDVWHAPNAAVSLAAACASALGCHVALDRTPPDALTEAWRWFGEGHWPLGHDLDSGRLVVF